MLGDDLHAREQKRKVKRDHVLQRHVALAPLNRIIQRDEARQDRRNVDPVEALLLALRIADHHREVQRQVRDIGEWVPGVDRERGQDREDLLAEDRVQLRQLLLADFVLAHEGNAGLGERRQDLAVVDRRLAVDQSLDPRADRLQLFEGRHAVRRGNCDRGQDLLLQTGDAHLEEVIQVLAEDGQKAHPFEEREPGIFRHRQYPLIEIEPRQLAVDVPGADRQKNRRSFWLGVGSDRHGTNSTGSIRGLGDDLCKAPEGVVAGDCQAMSRSQAVEKSAPVGAGRPAPAGSSERQAPSAATTFEKTFWIWLPMVKRITMTTIETRTRIRAYSTMPWPFWLLCRLSIFPPFSPRERIER